MLPFRLHRSLTIRFSEAIRFQPSASSGESRAGLRALTIQRRAIVSSDPTNVDSARLEQIGTEWTVILFDAVVANLHVAQHLRVGDATIGGQFVARDRFPTQRDYLQLVQSQ